MDITANITKFYCEHLKISQSYYNYLAWKVSTDQSVYIPEKFMFLSGVQPSNALPIEYEESPHDKAGDVRIDVPVWLGNMDTAYKRIMVFGLEPRATHSDFNIVRDGHNVFASPFGVDRWNDGTKVPGRQHIKYFKALQPLLELAVSGEACLLITDMVKNYAVVAEPDSAAAKTKNDQNARVLFLEKVIENRTLIIDEVGIYQPDQIIAFGNDSYNALRLILGDKTHDDNGYYISKVRHPANGGTNTARSSLQKISDRLINKK